MANTINIAVPKSVYDDAKKASVKWGYASVGAFVTAAIQKFKHSEKLTENGFTKEFEDEVLRRSAEPHDNDIILKTDEDIHNFFLHLKLPRKSSKHD